MAWLVVDKNGTERIHQNEPHREMDSWWESTLKDECHNILTDYYDGMRMPTGTIEKLIRRKLTWYSDPVEIK